MSFIEEETNNIKAIELELSKLEEEYQKNKCLEDNINNIITKLSQDKKNTIEKNKKNNMLKKHGFIENKEKLKNLKLLIDEKENSILFLKKDRKDYKYQEKINILRKNRDNTQNKINILGNRDYLIEKLCNINEEIKVVEEDIEFENLLSGNKYNNDNIIILENEISYSIKVHER